MGSIKVLEIFYLSIGEIAILTFPDKEYPRIGMILKREDGATWKITGTAMPTPSERTNGYKDLDPPRLIFDCRIEAQTPGNALKAGDDLTTI